MKYDDWEFFEMKMEEKLAGYHRLFEDKAKSMLIEYLGEAWTEMEKTIEVWEQMETEMARRYWYQSDTDLKFTEVSKEITSLGEKI